MNELQTWCQALACVAITLFTTGLMAAVDFFESDEWDSRPQWQREADFYADLIP